MSSSPISSGLVGESRDSIFHIFAVFLRLGCFSFGGPAAHLGYFRKSFVEQRRWLSDQEYGALVALSQFLPGPGSSQVGFALGMKQAGILGGIAAFIGFTLPSFLLMLWLALATSTMIFEESFMGLVHGLKLLAIVVVADACLGMFRSFCQQALTRVIALAASFMLLFAPGASWFPIALLVLAAIVGWAGLTPELEKRSGIPSSTDDTPPQLKSRLPLWITLAVIAALLVASVLATPSSIQVSFEAIFLEFFQIGSLVFGGGHVVLPLMEGQMLSHMMADRFLTGYSLAQAVPGPMFTLASFMGAEIGWQETQHTGAAILISLVATLGIFLPGLMLMAALMPYWQMLNRRPALMAVVKGVNAAVVGFLIQALLFLLLITLVKPFIGLSGSGMTAHLLTVLIPDLALLLMGWIVFKRFNLPLVWLVVVFAFSGVLMSLLI